MKKFYYSTESRAISQPKPKVLYPIADDDGVSAGRRTYFCHPSTILANKTIKPWMDCLPAVENQKYRLEKKLLACLNLQGLPIVKSPSPKKSLLEENNTGVFKTICLEGCRYDVVRRIALELGFRESSESEFWNILWTDTPISLDKALDMRRLQDAHKLFWGPILNTQKTNHFPGMHEICRKDRLARNLNRMQKIFNDEYTFFPKSWSLPADVPALLAHFQTSSTPTYICKPDSGCQGKGIFLVRNLKKINPFAKLIAQVYIPNPLLIDGYKFDLRIYILITSCDPLRIYIYNEGIARFATVKYVPPNDKNIDIVFMHLTNYSLNKFSQSYVAEPEGSKRKLSTIYGYFVEKGHNVGKIIEDIDDVIIKTVIAAQPTLRHYYRASFPKDDRGSTCFEILGFDILIDDNLKPWLLEVNLSPSFNLDLAVDAEIKERLLRDTFSKIYLGSLKLKPQRDTQMQKGVLNLPPPPCTEIMDKAGNQIPKMLQKQFYHEQLNQGNFRLVYPADNCKKYTHLLDPLVNLPTMNDLTSSRTGRPLEPYTTNDIEELSSLKSNSRGQGPCKIPPDNKNIVPTTHPSKSIELPYAQGESGEIGQADSLVKGKVEETSTISTITQQKLELLKSAAEAVAVSGGNIEELLSSETPRQPMTREPMERKETDVVKLALTLTQKKEQKRLKRMGESKECVIGPLKNVADSGIIVNQRDGFSRINHKDYCQAQRIKIPHVVQSVKFFDRPLPVQLSSSVKDKSQGLSFDSPLFPIEASREPMKATDSLPILTPLLPFTSFRPKFKKFIPLSLKVEQELRAASLKKDSPSDGDSFIPTTEKLKQFCLDSLSQGKGSTPSKNKLIEEWILNGAKKTSKKDIDKMGAEYQNGDLSKRSVMFPSYQQRRQQSARSMQFSSLVLTQEENERTEMLKEREKKIRQLGIEGKIFQMMETTGKLSFEEELIYKKIYCEDEFNANKNGNSTFLRGHCQSVSQFHTTNI